MKYSPLTVSFILILVGWTIYVLSFAMRKVSLEEKKDDTVEGCLGRIFMLCAMGSGGALSYIIGEAVGRKSLTFLLIVLTYMFIGTTISLGSDKLSTIIIDAFRSFRVILAIAAAIFILDLIFR